MATAQPEIMTDSIIPGLVGKQETIITTPGLVSFPDDVPPVAIITQGPLAWASSRFRGAWLQQADPNLFRWFPPDKELRLAGHKVLVFQKRHSPQDTLLAERAKERGVRIVVDLTDPLWWFDPQSVGKMMQIADVVTVSSAGLEKAVRDGGQVKRVVHIPDRMLPHFHPTTAQHGPREVVTLVWFGLAYNRVALTGALPILAYVSNMGHKIRLRIIDDLPTERMQVTGPFEIEHVPWTLETIHAQLTACDIAVLPPYPGPWGDLKGNNKQVTAGWCGLPVVDGYNPVELVALIADDKLRKADGERERQFAEKDYDIAQSVAQWRELLKELGVTP